MPDNKPTPPDPYMPSDRVAVERQLKALTELVKNGFAQIGAEIGGMRDENKKLSSRQNWLAIAVAVALTIAGCALLVAVFK